MLLWLDDDLEQGRNHTGFKLGANEELLLYQLEEGRPRIVDRAAGFSPVDDQTWALIPDGGSESIFTSGTPSYSNIPNGIEANHGERQLIYPCPADEYFSYPVVSNAKLYDSEGNLLRENINLGFNDCSDLSPGIYVIVNTQVAYRLVVIH